MPLLFAYSKGRPKDFFKGGQSQEKLEQIKGRKTIRAKKGILSKECTGKIEKFSWHGNTIYRDFPYYVNFNTM